MIWCWLDQLHRGWVTQAQVYLCCIPALQMNASATGLSAILESFGFGPSKTSSNNILLNTYTNKIAFHSSAFFYTVITSCLYF